MGVVSWHDPAVVEGGCIQLQQQTLAVGGTDAVGTLEGHFPVGQRDGIEAGLVPAQGIAVGDGVDIPRPGLQDPLAPAVQQAPLLPIHDAEIPVALPDVVVIVDLQLHVLGRHRAGTVVDRDRPAVLGLGIEKVVANEIGPGQSLGHQGPVAAAVEVRAAGPGHYRQVPQAAEIEGLHLLNHLALEGIEGDAVVCLGHRLILGPLIHRHRQGLPGGPVHHRPHGAAVGVGDDVAVVVHGGHGADEIVAQMVEIHRLGREKFRQIVRALPGLHCGVRHRVRRGVRLGDGRRDRRHGCVLRLQGPEGPQGQGGPQHQGAAGRHGHPPPAPGPGIGRGVGLLHQVVPDAGQGGKDCFIPLHGVIPLSIR